MKIHNKGGETLAFEVINNLKDAEKQAEEIISQAQATKRDIIKKLSKRLVRSMQES